MNRLWIAAMIMAFASIGIAEAAGPAERVEPAQPRVLADTVKPGQWEFTSQMQMPGGTQMPPGMQMPSGTTMPPGAEIGRASCRERVEIAVVEVGSVRK